MKKRALLSAIAMLVISAIVLTSATFAWFSMGTNVKATDINVTVSKADGLQISATNDESSVFKNSITFEEIQEANEDLPTGAINPVSSNDGTNFVGGVIDETGSYSGNTNTSGHYFTFPVYIKYLGSDTDAKVDLTGTTAAATNSAHAEKCIRIKAGGTGIFAPNSDTDEVFTYRKSDYNPASATNVVDSANDESLQVPLTPGGITTVYVTIWIEGDDTSCKDEIAAGGTVDVDLQFTRVQTSA